MGSLTTSSNPAAIAFYTASDLKSNKSLSTELVDIINLAFALIATFHKDAPRFEHPDELWQMLGSHGILAAARIDNVIGATASLAPWRPTPGGVIDQSLQQDRHDEYELAEQGRSYEVRAAATVQGSAMARKGLTGVLVRALLAEMDSRHPGQDVLLWVQISEEQAGPYWRKRGFERVGPVEIMPVGMWGALRPFEFMTMVRRVSVGSGLDR